MEIKDLIIVEIASVLAGPSVGMFFAELGAKVIKIENKLTNGDVTRSWKLPLEDQQSAISAYFSAINYGKDYVFANLKDETDYEKVLALIKTADILITNFKKGDDAKFKLDYKSIQRVNKDIIYAAISGFGTESDRVAYDLILQAESGFMSMNGTSESGPVKMPVALIDVLAGHQLKEGILVALLRKKQGESTYVSVSLYDAALASLANQASNYLMTGHVAERIGSLHPNIAPYGEIFTTADSIEITFAIGSQKQFGALMAYLKLDYLLGDERFSDNTARVKNRAALASLMSGKISSFDSKVILDYCHANYIPAAEIKNMAKVFASDNAKGLVLSETIDGIDTKRVKSVAFKSL